MVAIDLSEPTDIVDKLLWRDARRILARHCTADGFGRCSWCGESWPCPPRTLAQRAESAAWRPANDVWDEVPASNVRIGEVPAYNVRMGEVPAYNVLIGEVSANNARIGEAPAGDAWADDVSARGEWMSGVASRDVGYARQDVREVRAGGSVRRPDHAVASHSSSGWHRAGANRGTF